MIDIKNEVSRYIPNALTLSRLLVLKEETQKLCLEQPTSRLRARSEEHCVPSTLRDADAERC